MAYDVSYKAPKQEECPCYNKVENIKKKGQLMDLLHPEGEICEINKTAFCKRPNYYEKWRPPSGKYLDYDLREMDTKMVKGGTKVHLINTSLSYGELNPNPPPPKPPTPPPKKEVYFHGIDPCWEFVEEKYWRKEMAKQEIYKRELKEMVRRRKKQERLERKLKKFEEIKIKKPKEKNLHKHQPIRKIQLDNGIEKAKERWRRKKEGYLTEKVQVLETPQISCRLINKMKHNSYFHGRLPCWVFVDEIWEEKYKEQQEYYKERLKGIIRNRKKEDRIRKYLEMLEIKGLI